MDKYKNNALVEQMDAIVLINDNYIAYGLKAGYIGTVIDNFIDKQDIIVVDFSNPFTGKTIQPIMDIRKEDFRVLSNSTNDKKLIKEFKELFLK